MALTRLKSTGIDSPIPLTKGGTNGVDQATAKSNLGLSTVATSGAYSDLSGKPTLPSGSVRLYLKKVDLATFIDLNDEKTRSGVFALETSGLLSSGRASIILDTAPTDSERI